MRPDDVDYDLPEDLVARFPPARRGDARLLQVDGEGGFHDLTIDALVDCVSPGDLLVVNDTRVIPARLFGRRRSGGRVEVLLERVTGPSQASAQLRANRKPKTGETFEIVDAAGTPVATATLTGRADRFFLLAFDAGIEEVTARAGHVPLPPYLGRVDEPTDRERYQTVYADEPGAVAAPTAGLHFDADLLARLEAHGVQRVAVTLHVAAGTFQPLDDSQLASGRLHAEAFNVSAAVVAAVDRTHAAGGRVIAVGTTALRALESAALSGVLQATSGDTDLFIRPGFPFRVVDRLLTNFHLPRSSLMMLVAAFAGHARIMSAYRHAVRARYRFFSYGDAMLLTRADTPCSSRS